MADNVNQVPASQISREVAEKERTKLLGGNEYKPLASEYNESHKNALSDGDDKGKGETSTVGSKTDIQERAKLTTINLYGANKPYTSPE
jgi:hypothetical protein